MQKHASVKGDGKVFEHSKAVHALRVAIFVKVVKRCVSNLQFNQGICARKRCRLKVVCVFQIHVAARKDVQCSRLVQKVCKVCCYGFLSCVECAAVVVWNVFKVTQVVHRRHGVLNRKRFILQLDLFVQQDASPKQSVGAVRVFEYGDCEVSVLACS